MTGIQTKAVLYMDDYRKTKESRSGWLAGRCLILPQCYG